MRLEIKCNEKLNPIGVDFSDLRFSLATEGVGNIKHVEYEFYLEEKVNTGKFFQKEKVYGRFLSIGFDGFHAGDRLFYRAIVTTSEEKYTTQFFVAECGLQTKEIVGQWIENASFDGRVSEFCKSFSFDDEVVRARLYVVGLGFYYSTLNGQKTDDDYFKPLLTDFDERRNLSNNPCYDEENFINGKKTVCYDTYDVTDLLRQGENELRVLLGTGWYCNEDKDFVDPSFTFGKPKLFFELHLEGKTEKRVIKSDESCLVRSTHCRSQLFAGDFVDFSQAAEEFRKAELCAPPTGKLIPALTENDAVIERLEAVGCKRTGNKLLFDFGKNHTGGLRLSVRGKRDEKISVKYYEVLYPDGTPNPITCRWVAYLDGKEPIGYMDQQGEYVLSGGVDEIQPLFHWSCYRYAEVELPDGCEIISVQSWFISANVALDGEFACSHKELNEIYGAFVLTQRDNMHCGVPSDCPHREKLPYTGDGQLVAESALYAFGTENFYRKWLKDIIAAQGNDGWVPYTAPYICGGGGYWWCNALASVPLTLYRFTGDLSVLRDSLQSAVRLIGYYNKMHDGDYIIKRSCASWLLGDWLAPEEISSNISYINTLAFYFAVSQTKKMAAILGERKIEGDMEALLTEIKNSINENFFDKEGLRYGNGVQGEDLMPLMEGIVPEEYKEALWEKVVAHYKRTGCFDTGIVLTPVLLEALTARGETKLVMDLMLRTEYPSFLWMLQGETTLCEHWSKFWPKTSSAEGEEEPLTGDVSHCHPMYGSVVAWMYKHVAGLDLSELCNGKILFAPKFVDLIPEGKARKQTAFGEAAIVYDAYGSLKMQIKVPHGLEGELRIPARICESFYAISEGREQVKSRKRRDYIYVKLSGGDWQISSVPSFGR